MLYQPEEFPQSSAAASAVDSEDINAGMELENQENEEIDISSLLDLDLEVVTVTVPAEPAGAFAGESEVATTVGMRSSSAKQYNSVERQEKTAILSKSCAISKAL